MLPQHIILSIFGALLAQGNAIQAIPVNEPLFTRSESLPSHNAHASLPSNADSSLSTRDNDHTTLLSTRGEVTTAVTAAAIPALCVLGHKILGGIVVYVNCPEPVKNLQAAAANLKKAGKQAINFAPNSDFNARRSAVIAAAPPAVKVPLGKAIAQFSNELLKASFIIMDTAASAVYRAGGDHADVGGNALHPAPAPASRPASPAAGSVRRPASPRPASLPAGSRPAKAPKKANSWRRDVGEEDEEDDE